MGMICPDRAREIVKRQEIRDGLCDYQKIRALLAQEDGPQSEEFQKIYAQFYRMRQWWNDESLDQYFSVMQDILQELQEGKDLSFKNVFDRVRAITDKMEMSFSSKLLHTLDNRYPIWDHIVAERHFGYVLPPAKCVIRDQACVKRYEQFRAEFMEFAGSAEGETLIQIFDEQYPESGISDVKKLDFILWQDR